LVFVVVALRQIPNPQSPIQVIITNIYNNILQKKFIIIK